MQAADVLIAADGGLIHCVDHGVWPDVVVGDLDSAPAGLVAQAKAHGARIAAHPADKDQTDLELAVDEAVEAGAATLTVIGALGGRFDHAFAAISMLASRARSSVAIALDDGAQRVDIVHDRIELALAVGATASVIPIGGPAGGVTTSGFRWSLDKAPLPFGSTLGVSNEAVASTQSVSIETGTVLVVVSGSR